MTKNKDFEDYKHIYSLDEYDPNEDVLQYRVYYVMCELSDAKENLSKALQGTDINLYIQALDKRDEIIQEVYPLIDELENYHELQRIIWETPLTLILF